MNRPLRKLHPLALLAVLGSLGFSSCSPSLVRHKEIAATGTIDSSARVTGKASILIHAPSQAVWNALVRAKAWPEWNPDIKQVRVEGELEPGRIFLWGPTFPEIESEVIIALPGRKLVWVGSMLHLKAIHSWEMHEKDGRTLVTTEESLDGPMAAWVFGPEKLKANLEKWLAALKREAEPRGSARE